MLHRVVQMPRETVLNQQRYKEQQQKESTATTTFIVIKTILVQPWQCECATVDVGEKWCNNRNINSLIVCSPYLRRTQRRYVHETTSLTSFGLIISVSLKLTHIKPCIRYTLPVNCRMAIRSFRLPSFSGASQGRTHSDDDASSEAMAPADDVVLKSVALFCGAPLCDADVCPHASARYPSKRSRTSIQWSSSHYNEARE